MKWDEARSPVTSLNWTSFPAIDPNKKIRPTFPILSLSLCQESASICYCYCCALHRQNSPEGLADAADKTTIIVFIVVSNIFLFGHTRRKLLFIRLLAVW